MNLIPLKRVLACTLFLTVISCSNSPEKWKVRKIDASNDAVCSHLLFPPANSFRNLEVCFSKEDNEIKVFLNAYSIPFQKDQNGMTLVTITIDQNPFSFKCPVLAGNQRIFIPKETASMLLIALNEKKDIVISAGKYSTEIHYEEFEKIFYKFNSH